jgi:N-acetylmuramic acid 6-phosphate etherase
LPKQSILKDSTAMANRRQGIRCPLFLGIEGGATHTTAILASAHGVAVKRIVAGPANLRLLSDLELVALLRSLAVAASGLVGVAIGLAGARTASDRQRIRAAAAKVWPAVPCYATNDLETGLTAGERPSERFAACVLVLSGTGSCCFGRAALGTGLKVGGWGHVLGDRGSGYDIGLRALQRVVHHHDVEGTWPLLGSRVLRRAQLNGPEDLVAWAQRAEKRDIAGLAIEVFEACKTGDAIARDIVRAAARTLADDAVACAGRLVGQGARVQFVLAGGVLRRQARFARQVARLVHAHWRNAVVTRLRHEGAWGAVELAKRQFQSAQRHEMPRASSPAVPLVRDGRATDGSAAPAPPGARHRGETSTPPDGAISDASASPVSLQQLSRSPTEQRNPRSLNLDRLSLEAAIRLMLSEEARIPRAIRAQSPAIVRTIHAIVRAFRNGGRLFYVGAGTSGRLGVLDASECPPTFGTPPDSVQGIMAGGVQALSASVEGAEDDPAAGVEAVTFRGVTERDVVVGIATSGRTPFVWGALDAAKARGAFTVLLCFNPGLSLPRTRRPKVVIAPNVGPEVLTGSTRLKAGTATKLILNLFTTLAMVRLGKVVSNLMVDVNPSNVKLRDRAVRIVRQLTGANETEAQRALRDSGWVVKAAWRKLRSNPCVRARSNSHRCLN